MKMQLTNSCSLNMHYHSQNSRLKSLQEFNIDSHASRRKVCFCNLSGINCLGKQGEHLAKCGEGMCSRKGYTMYNFAPRHGLFAIYITAPKMVVNNGESVLSCWPKSPDEFQAKNSQNFLSPHRGFLDSKARCTCGQLRLTTLGLKDPLRWAGNITWPLEAISRHRLPVCFSRRVNLRRGLQLPAPPLARRPREIDLAAKRVVNMAPCGTETIMNINN